jgi:SulP family sulfate permease
MHRMAQAVGVEAAGLEDQADSAYPRERYDPSTEGSADIMVYRLTGPFFFGATANVAQVLDRIGRPPRGFILDFSAVPFVDSSAANMLETFARGLARDKVTLVFTGTNLPVRTALEHHGLGPERVRYAASIADARTRLTEPNT